MSDEGWHNPKPDESAPAVAPLPAQAQSGTRYIEEFSITGLTSNPTIFDGAIGGGQAYDTGIREKARTGQSGERLFIELALEDPHFPDEQDRLVRKI